MVEARKFVVVLVTAPSLPIARKLVRAALEQRLAACANLIPRIESHYWWQGRQESSREVLILFKTARSRLPELERCLRQLHPYDIPEFLVLSLRAGSKRYLDWLADSIK